MTRTLTLLSTTLLTGLSTSLTACSPDAETFTERNTVVLSDSETMEAEDTPFLDPARDPEGDSLQGEPEGEPGEAVDYESINENEDGNDPIETASRDADPLE